MKRQPYMPDVKKVLEEHDPATFDERQRKALAKVYEAGLIDRLTPEPDAQHAAREAAGYEVPAAKVEKRPRRKTPAWIVAIAVAAVALPAAVAVVLSARSTDRKVAEAIASARAAATLSAPMPEASATAPSTAAVATTATSAVTSASASVAPRPTTAPRPTAAPRPPPKPTGAAGTATPSAAPVVVTPPEPPPLPKFIQ